MTKHLTRIVTIWCDHEPPFCSKCIGLDCPHAYGEFDYDTVRTIHDKPTKTNP